MSEFLTYSDRLGGLVIKDGPSSYKFYLTEQHMCGLSGYNPMLGDTCPACEQTNNLRGKMLDLERSDKTK